MSLKAAYSSSGCNNSCTLDKSPIAMLSKPLCGETYCGRCDGIILTGALHSTLLVEWHGFTPATLYPYARSNDMFFAQERVLPSSSLYIRLPVQACLLFCVGVEYSWCRQHIYIPCFLVILLPDVCCSLSSALLCVYGKAPAAC